MKPWNARPIEVKNLFNPAFCALVLMRALRSYEEHTDVGMPYSLSLLILPLCLHKASRDVFVNHSRSYLLKVISDNPEVGVGFAQRAATLIPYSLEGLGFAMHMNCFIVSESGHLSTVPKCVRQAMSGTPETVACQRVARYLGREFAEIADRATIYTALRVRP